MAASPAGTEPGPAIDGEEAMRLGPMPSLVLLLAAACASPSPPVAAPHPQPAALPAPPPPAPPPSSAVTAEADALAASLAREVPQHTGCGAESETWVAGTRGMLAAAGVAIDRAELVVAVDRNPSVQELCLVLVRPDAAWRTLGGGKVSTGQAGRKGYYITPVGVFRHDGGIIDYRALGTVNENGIRGLGAKGMRVWDFGWQWAEKGWLPDHQMGEIRLLLHATDPDLLEPRLGRPASQGCVRISGAMNRFLDRHGVLDADYERAAATDERITAVLDPERQPTPLAGNLLVIFDSEREPTAAAAGPPAAGRLPSCT
jgi:hypothetical protein